MTSSGRCHGPGCTQTADEDFCSERCSMAWQAQFWHPEKPFNGEHGPVPPGLEHRLPSYVWEHYERLFEDASRAATQVRESGPASDIMGDILRAYDLVRSAPPPPEPVKVTREQWRDLRAASPVYPEYARPNTLSGVPVVLVDDPADATFPPASATFTQVASDVHSIDMEEQRGPRRRRWWRRSR